MNFAEMEAQLVELLGIPSRDRTDEQDRQLAQLQAHFLVSLARSLASIAVDVQRIRERGLPGARS